MPSERRDVANPSLNKDRLVLDCNVYLQFLLNATGPAGQCVAMGLQDQIELFVCPELLQEIHELPEKNVGIERGITLQIVRRLTEELLDHAALIQTFPVVYTHPIDPDDSFYVNLAAAAAAKFLVSSDKHLLNLINPAKPWSKEFRYRFADIRVLTPAHYLEYAHSTKKQGS